MLCKHRVRESVVRMKRPLCAAFRYVCVCVNLSIVTNLDNKYV